MHIEISRSRVNMMYPPVGQLAAAAVEAASSAALLSAAVCSAAVLSASVAMVMMKATRKKWMQTNEDEQSRGRRSPKT
jgi:hypothetical protein